jgi:hypothetical protein
LKMERIRCPETSVKDYQSTLRNIPEEGRSPDWLTILFFWSICVI